MVPPPTSSLVSLCPHPSFPPQIDVLLFCAAPVVFLLLLHVDPVSVLVPLGSGLVAASFVFAPTVQSFVVSLVFVLIQHPFDIGDIVRRRGRWWRPAQAQQACWQWERGCLMYT